ncbi:MAG: adenosylcobalamin-dependent ribonucleoside-diphosphate reductase [Phycisphaerae bacterium]|nr:adenosylcobalamin-dependent ribonucleoside-diphosphate reductase [Phycisphaerae bacterium]
MKITRKFTKDGQDPFATVSWVRRTSRITNPDGSVVFEMKDAEVPETWTQLATDIMVSKYFRKAGVPADGGANGYPVEGPCAGPERSARQVIHRLVGCWRHWGEKHGYFDSAGDAQAFYDELVYMMVHQMCAPNSPQWFNTGLSWAYGISGPAQGHFVPDPRTGEVCPAEDAYTHPQPHACFIQSVDDDLVNEGGIMDLWVREARLFKYGSGTGTNFSRLRGEGEKLSGGGKSSGLMSWLRIGDRAASAIKSGGTTRRAAKMVCLDMDHPDIETFINWKVREELKVQAMVEGQRLLMKTDPSFAGTAGRMGLELDYDFNGEAYQTVSGQNSNNSVRIPDSFFAALDAGAAWETRWRTSAAPARTFDARALWGSLCHAAWRCADPGVQYDTTINAWHTCPGAGPINASNPCSEYMFLDNTACNLASLNLLRFYDAGTRTFDVEGYEHGIDLWTVVLEVSVLMAAYPSRKIAELSWKYRTLGLGFANLGAMLMQAGVPYDSDGGRAIGASLSAILTGRSYRASAHMAREHGPFPGFAPERDSMLRVVRNHRLAAHGEKRDSERYEGLNPGTRPVPIDHDLLLGLEGVANVGELSARSKAVWDEALGFGERWGYRNAQVSVIAPTGTIGLLMDCDTTGVEPDFALVKFKKLAGGGYFKIANESVAPALRALGYTDAQIKKIMTYLLGTLDLDVPMPTDVKGVGPGQTLAGWLVGKGLTDADVREIASGLPGVFELSFAFAAWSVPDEALRRCGVDPGARRSTPGFNLLKELGLKDGQIERLNEVVCGRQTVEGAPGLKDEHLPVFDCANTCGRIGKRFIAPEGHIRMMAAVQPFVTGAISKTINLPHSATVEDIGRCYRLSWELGLKANALYRDGCKLSQPLSSNADGDKAREGTAGNPPSAGSGATTSSEPSAIAPVAATSAASPLPELAAVESKPPAIVKPTRRRLPETRRSFTHRFNIAGHEGYLTVGLYDDGKPGELFITMSKEGSTIGGLMDSLGTATSVALQYGVPIESLVNKFSHQRFEPAGMTENSEIPFAKSLVDYIFRWMGMQFIPGYREQHAPSRGALGSNAPAGAERPPRPEDGRWNHASEPSGGRMGGLSAGGPAPGPASPAPGASRASLVGLIEQTTTVVVATVDPMSVANAEHQADAPPCDVCGTITVRSGMCYKCLNCGNSMGCS